MRARCWLREAPSTTGWYPDPSQRNHAHPVTGGQFYGVSAPLGEVVDALSEYRSIWRLLTDERGWGRDVVLVGSQEAATVFSRRSSFHKHLAVQRLEVH